MFDIDKYLNEMEIKDMSIDEELMTRTKKRCDEEQEIVRQQRESLKKKLKKGLLIAVPAAAVLLIGVLVGALFFSGPGLDAVAYYTVDVNPSICVHVDAEGKVTSVVSQNEDAQAIVDSLNVTGENVTDAIKKIITAIKDAGYFDAGQKYVLIGCFAADGTLVQGSLDNLQAQLEADFGDMIDLLLVSGDLKDLQQADQLKVSAGLLKLAQLVGSDASGDKKVEDVLNDVKCVDEGNYCAPEISASVSDKINISWDQIDFEAMGYAGKVRYSIAAGDTAGEVLAGDAEIVKTLTFYTYAEQPLSASVSIDPGVTKYFALYAQYGESVKYSNAVMATMPGEKVTPSPSPTETDKPEPTNTPPLAAHTMSGRVSGDKVVLTWSKETAENFSGYKVVASKTNPTPSYPEDGYIKFITDLDTTSASFYAGSCGLEANTSYYFSITYLLGDGTKIAANAVRLKVPAKSEEPQPEEPGTEHPACNITSASISDSGTVTLHWAKAPDNDFTYYKVVGSFTDSKPRYPENGYLDYFGRDCTSASFSLSKLSKLDEYAPGKTCYFSITAVYGDLKVPGNVKALKMPDTPAPTAKPYASTNISASFNSDKTRINFSWNTVNDERFCYYKLVGSRSANPSYDGGDCLLYYSDNMSTHSWSISVEDLICELGGGPGETYYFAITIIYEYDCDTTYKTGADASKTLPLAPTDPPPTDPPPTDPPPTDPPPTDPPPTDPPPTDPPPTESPSA